VTVVGCALEIVAAAGVADGEQVLEHADDADEEPADPAVFVAAVERLADDIVAIWELCSACVSDRADDAEVVAYTSKVVVVTPDAVVAVAGSVSVLCVADTALVRAEQTL